MVLARSAAGLADATITSDVVNVEQIRIWFGRPLWEMEPADADTYFGTVLRNAAKGTRQARSRALRVYFLFLEIRHKVELHQLTGRVVACPIDEMNRPRGAGKAALRIPPSAAQVKTLFAGWRQELAGCRKFAPAVRNYAAARLMAEVGLRVNEVTHLDLADIKWDLGPFGKLHVRQGKGARGSGPRERMVPLVNDAGATLRWFVQDVWSCFDDDYTRPGAPLFCSERCSIDGTADRVGNETLRSTLPAAAEAHLADWTERVPLSSHRSLQPEQLRSVRPSRTTSRMPAVRESRSGGSHVHHVSLVEAGARLRPGSLAMGTPQTFPMAAPGSK